MKNHINIGSRHAELEEYLAEEEEEDLEMDMLDYWRRREVRWPNLAKMVKQYFAQPASSAGVERVFSAAGRMHSDLRKSLNDHSLEHSLFGAYNTPKAAAHKAKGDGGRRGDPRRGAGVGPRATPPVEAAAHKATAQRAGRNERGAGDARERGGRGWRARGGLATAAGT